MAPLGEGAYRTGRGNRNRLDRHDRRAPHRHRAWHRGAHCQYRRTRDPRARLSSGARQAVGDERHDAADHGRAAGRHDERRRLRGGVAAISRRSSTSRTRSTATIISRSRRPASTGRWCGARISRRWAGHVAKIELEQTARRAQALPRQARRRRGRRRPHRARKGRRRHRSPWLPLAAIAEAKLVLTDDLIKESLRRQKPAAGRR